MYSISCEGTHIAHLVKFVIKVLIVWLCPNGGKSCISTFLYRYFGRKAERRIMAQVYVIGRVTADFEKKISANQNPYVRFDLAENIGNKEERRTQYFQICAMGGDAERLTRARVKKGSLLWISGSLEMETFTKRDGSPEKRLKILLDNWGFVPINMTKETGDHSREQTLSGKVMAIDGERDPLPE